MNNQPRIVIADNNNIAAELREEVPLILNFTATWCGPCKSMAPVLEHIAHKYAGKVKLVKADLDHNRWAAEHYQISSVPTIIVGLGGEELKIAHVFSGFVPAPEIESVIEIVLNEVA